MKKIFAALALVATIAAPAAATEWRIDNQRSNTGADGFKFTQTQQPQTELRVHLVYYMTLEELRAAYAEATKDIDWRQKEQARDVFAFSQVNTETGECTIHTIHPASKYKPEKIGHELVHCSFGVFH